MKPTVFQLNKKRARDSRAAIEKIYITMRQLLIRGSYKPNGISGRALKEGLFDLSPEIYGDINDPEKVELEGLLYVMERLPKGIEECRFVKLVAREGFENAGLEVIIPTKRRRNCYRIDQDRMYIEMTRGRSDIYDILTHLTFLYIEADKIKNHCLDSKGRVSDDWKRLEDFIEMRQEGADLDENKATVYLSNIIGRTIDESKKAIEEFRASKTSLELFDIIFWLSKLSIEELKKNLYKEISFSAKLREIIGHHIYGELWANNIKNFIYKKGWIQRPIHIISANLHSIKNTLYGLAAIKDQSIRNIEELALKSSIIKNADLRDQIHTFALQHGLYEIHDHYGTNLSVQIFDFRALPEEVLQTFVPPHDADENTLLLVMDYAFGEQAYECFDELLKPFETESEQIPLNIASITIMGKAGILNGEKGDIMIPTSFVFEGTADNYPLDNDFKKDDFEHGQINCYEGTMITVLGTSLQNRDVLYHFLQSSWEAIGLEMEGAHYQKAIQAATRIRKSVKGQVKVRYAYYASDNPLITGNTLASGSLGPEGVKPTYLITKMILQKILNSTNSCQS
ncbi:MAG: DUF6909 family protein [Candidatus Cyclobacteriaceae bacterium M3_2C_046]